MFHQRLTLLKMKRIGVFTSGGDAQGMNAAVRAVVRTALDRGVEAYAIYEGFQGLVDGGDRIRPITWNDVGGILHQGGTIIGSARCNEFRERSGRLKAVRNLLLHKIEGLVVIGGDGSLSGAEVLYDEWASLTAELVSSGEISQKVADQHASILIVGIIGSIDNDMFGSDVTTGVDTALHRIIEATDAITSTAASHQRSFVVEVMGRHCGYLALMSALASGADWVLIPENPPNVDDWEETMCRLVHKGREAGRRDSLIIIAEGAQDRDGNPITREHIKHVLESRLGEDTRITVLGHVQRGGSPSAFDRNLSTLLGTAAVEELLSCEPTSKPFVMGMRGNKISRTPLGESLSITRSIADAMASKDFEEAVRLRGQSFQESFRIVRTLVRSFPHPPLDDRRRLRVAILHGGALAPGMNTAVRAAVRLGADSGHRMLGVYHGFKGLIEGNIEELDWMSVNGWAGRGGADLGSNRYVPSGSDFYAIARNLEEHKIDALLMVGGWHGYQGAVELHRQRHDFPSFDIPIICLPASISNNLPGAELSVGADTALNSIVTAVDKIKQSAVAARRTFVVEVMGHYCGYLAAMSALATGAERVYLHEESVTLADLVDDINMLTKGFRMGKRLGLMIRSEKAHEIYTTSFMHALFEEEGGGLFDVRESILGHLQQGGAPTPFDRIMATRLATHCIKFLDEQINVSEPRSVCIGQIEGEEVFTDLEDISRLMDKEHSRPKKQWWMDLRATAKIFAKPGPQNELQL